MYQVLLYVLYFKQNTLSVLYHNSGLDQFYLLYNWVKRNKLLEPIITLATFFVCVCFVFNQFIHCASVATAVIAHELEHRAREVILLC